jgi:hypothetical protein
LTILVQRYKLNFKFSHFFNNKCGSWPIFNVTVGRFLMWQLAVSRLVIWQSLEFHIEGMVADGDDVPQWLVEGDYEFEYRFLDATSLLRAYGPYLSLAAISRASGINQHQLSHYANGIKRPRAQQRERIVEGIHKIGKELLALV